MTYIAAFRCEGGIVMCADTLETYQDQDYKEYVEKLEIGKDFPISIGGAGVGEIIEATTQEIIDRCNAKAPKTKSALRELILDSLAKVYEEDVPTLVLHKQARSPELLIAAKPTKEDFCIFRARALRVFEVQQFRIVGYGTRYNNALLRRLFRKNLTMLQAVVLASYLVSQSKLLDEPVGGEITVTIVTQRGAFQESDSYISYLEKRANEFLKHTDALFLACLDTTVGEKRLRKYIERFAENAINQYRKHIDSTLESLSMKEVLEGHPYQKSPIDTLFGLGPEGVKAIHGK